jgi:hypothetical protein
LVIFSAKDHTVRKCGISFLPFSAMAASFAKISCFLGKIHCGLASWFTSVFPFFFFFFVSPCGLVLFPLFVLFFSQFLPSLTLSCHLCLTSGYSLCITLPVFFFLSSQPWPHFLFFISSFFFSFFPPIYY